MQRFGCEEAECPDDDVETGEVFDGEFAGVLDDVDAGLVRAAESDDFVAAVAGFGCNETSDLARRADDSDAHMQFLSGVKTPSWYLDDTSLVYVRY